MTRSTPIFENEFVAGTAGFIGREPAQPTARRGELMAFSSKFVVQAGAIVAFSSVFSVGESYVTGSRVTAAPSKTPNGATTIIDHERHQPSIVNVPGAAPLALMNARRVVEDAAKLQMTPHRVVSTSENGVALVWFRGGLSRQVAGLGYACLDCDGEGDMTALVTGSTPPDAWSVEPDGVNGFLVRLTEFLAA